MESINVMYISVAGNTRYFIQNLTEYANQQHQNQSDNPLINPIEISDQSDFEAETKNFFAFVPTYLDGGNGTDNGVKELMTNTLGEYIDYKNNADYCIGVIGSGNKNFNDQYCLTAKRYAKKFNAPFVADFELRGSNADLARIYEDLKSNVLSNT